MNVTLKKISEVLGLSISTVSRALQNHPDISIHTRQKVVELAGVLDYEPNANAINLRKQNSRVFGLMVPSVSNSFYGSFMAAIEKHCQKAGYSLIIMQSGDNAETEKNILKIYRQNRVAGCFACLSPGDNDMSGFKKLADLDIPVVFFDKVPEDSNCNKVYIDNVGAAKQAAEALIKNGKKNILTIYGSEQLAISRLRKEAFSLISKKYATVQLHPENATSSQEATDITLRYFKDKEKPDAVFCMSDEILVGAMKALQKLDVKYPDEVSILAMSDGFYPGLYFPTVTYVETSGYKLGETAYKMMEDCMNDHSAFQEKKVVSSLMEGGSL